MAVTADMEHLRNREGQDRNMTTPIAHCVRCQRPAPPEDDPDFLHWEVLLLRSLDPEINPTRSLQRVLLAPVVIYSDNQLL